jgi:chemotaxis protein methyltransferase WspC
MPFLEAGFKQVDYPQSFACRKARPTHVAPGFSPARAPTSRGATPPETEALQSIFRRSQISTQAAATISQPRKPRRIAPANARKPLSVAQAAAPPPGIEEAGQLADRGELEAASAICRRLLAEGSQDPDVYSLLGVLSESGGKLETAADLFRKALFLDPHHYQSLVHMSLLCERHGDIDGSSLYRARAGRVFSHREGDQAA